ncbi:FMN-binding domain protein [Planctomycetes bacterium CA13]|uniref:FMN-binding domain protein n=1 Tax=Novipirellula herctigrandis TaxID=2527986 RepID=A0A5C5YY71_9BACT|nr:FMN-binding domain protein [Planctomycetes bacterium CA13]
MNLLSTHRQGWTLVLKRLHPLLRKLPFFGHDSNNPLNWDIATTSGSSLRCVRDTLCFIASTVTVLLVLGTAPSCAQDLVEFTNGTTVQGEMLEIRKDAKEFNFKLHFGGQQVSRTFPYSDVHAVTLNGKRFVLTPKIVSEPNTSDTQASGLATKKQGNRTKAEVLQIIEKAGNTPPDWLASTAMNHPASLDLDWPLRSPGPWNESKNVGQYIWGRINPNVSRWKSGIKLVHQCMKRHQQDPLRLTRDMEKLGDMYFTLLQDYPRAAYWLQKSNSPIDKETGVFLAECYWRLGNDPMALEKLQGKRLHFNTIKLLGDMGEIDMALRVTDTYAKTNFFNEAFLNAGDALRGAGRYDEAIEYYQKVIDRNTARNAEYLKRFQARANGAIEAIELFDRADVSRVGDGTYTASSVGYNGQLEVEVKISDSQIQSVRVTKHTEKQFFAALTDTPNQIIANQSFRSVDGTSGATVTSQAIIHATARAMAKGVK